MARILILGGTGAQGWQAAKTALSLGTKDDHIVLVSRDQSRGSEAATRLSPFANGRNVTSVYADLLEPSSLAAHVRHGDIVLNAAAPFFELGATAAQVAIDGGAHYFDICDDWEATVPILALHDRATAQHVASVTGFGAAPGITSMLATIAMRELDEVHEIITAWPVAGGGSSPQPSNTPFVHFVQCCVGPIRLMRDGRMADEEPLKQESIALPNDAELTGYTIGSPESVTLPAGRGSIRTSLNLALMSHATADGLRTLAQAVRDGELSLADAGNLLGQGSDSNDESPTDESSQICAVATGLKDGVQTSVRTRLSAWPLQSGYTVAGTALGLAPSLLAAGVINVIGAHSIEAALSPEIYLDALARAVSPNFKYQVETVSSAIKQRQAH